MKLEINNEILIALQKKYGRLIYVICKNISGDPAVLSSHEDNEQELLIKCVEAVNSYSNKIGEPDITKFVFTREFDKYIKTCLWNLKNNKGCTIQKKHSKKKYVLDHKDEGEIKNIEALDDTFSLDINLNLCRSEETSSLIEKMVNNPNSICDFEIDEISKKFRGKMCL